MPVREIPATRIVKTRRHQAEIPREIAIDLTFSETIRKVGKVYQHGRLLVVKMPSATASDDGVAEQLDGVKKLTTNR